MAVSTELKHATSIQTLNKSELQGLIRPRVEAVVDSEESSYSAAEFEPLSNGLLHALNDISFINALYARDA